MRVVTGASRVSGEFVSSSGPDFVDLDYLVSALFVKATSMTKNCIGHWAQQSLQAYHGNTDSYHADWTDASHKVA